jgi:acyl-coenzyme A thioesterase 13
MKIEKEHLNRGGGLHGGLSSTIVDVVTTYALMSHTEDNIKAGVSVDLHVSFLKGAKENDELIIEAKTIKCGKTLAFLDCEIRNKKCNSILVRGSHTKFVGSG